VDFVKLLLTSPFFEALSGDFFLIATLLWWALAIAIMFYFDGDWKDFLMYFLWSIAIGIGLILLIVPGLIILAIFLWQHGLINLIPILLGPVGWAIGATQGWYD